MTDAVPTRTPTAGPGGTPSGLCPAEQMTAADQSQGTRRLTVQDRRMLTAQGWKMTLVRRPVTAPRSQPQR